MRHYQESRNPKDLPKINLNEATFEKLVRLPGIGPVTANRIIECRRQGRFRHIEDLIFKVGLRQSLVDQLSNRLEV
jgi:DNA uptake protein ComE-like DNA-binding protein